MFPEENALSTPYKQSRSSHSFTKYKQEEARPEKRQRSLIQAHNKGGNSSPLKLK